MKDIKELLSTKSDLEKEIAARKDNGKGKEEKAIKVEHQKKDSFADLIESTVDVELNVWKETPSKLSKKRKLEEQPESSKSVIRQEKVKMLDINEQLNSDLQTDSSDYVLLSLTVPKTTLQNMDLPIVVRDGNIILETTGHCQMNAISQDSWENVTAGLRKLGKTIGPDNFLPVRRVEQRARPDGEGSPADREGIPETTEAPRRQNPEAFTGDDGQEDGQGSECEETSVRGPRSASYLSHPKHPFLE